MAAVALVLLASTVMAQAPATSTFAWDANPPDGHTIGYQLTVDGSSVVDAGAALTASVPLEPGPHTAALRAYWSDVVPPVLSPPTPTLSFTVAGQVKPDPCADSPATVVVSGYSAALKGGDEGLVTVRVTGPAAVVQIQILLGPQVVGQVDGGELRFIRAVGFGSPRIAGTYHLFVAAKDARGCTPRTTLDRPLVIS